VVVNSLPRIDGGINVRREVSCLHGLSTEPGPFQGGPLSESITASLLPSTPLPAPFSQGFRLQYSTSHWGVIGPLGSPTFFFCFFRRRRQNRIFPALHVFFFPDAGKIRFFLRRNTFFPLKSPLRCGSSNASLEVVHRPRSQSLLLQIGEFLRIIRIIRVDEIFNSNFSKF